VPVEPLTRLWVSESASAAQGRAEWVCCSKYVEPAAALAAGAAPAEHCCLPAAAAADSTSS